MDDLIAQVRLTDVHADLIRNIVSIRVAQDLFDDLSDQPAHWAVAQAVEGAARPQPYQSASPIIDRPFEDARWFNAIGWPFRHWQASRFSDGSFGVWYGCDTVETSVHETAYHWFSGFLRDAGFDTEAVVGERKVYSVACDAALLDLRPLASRHPALLHKTDYGYTQALGARLHREGHPGLVTRSARYRPGHHTVVLNPAVLTDPRDHCLLTYRLREKRIVVERQPGVAWMEISTARF